MYVPRDRRDLPTSRPQSSGRHFYVTVGTEKELLTIHNTAKCYY
jgi:hypothetical protein